MSQRTAEKKPPAPSTDALAALLASHPEECADVLALLVTRYPHRGIYQRDASAERLLILDALCADGVVCREGNVYLLNATAEEHMAIARVGATAWLRARVGPTAPLTYGQRIAHSLARLHDIAAAALRTLDMVGALAVAKVVDHAWTGSERDYRDALTKLAALGWTLDVEAEVAAVWGPAPKEQG